MSPGNRHIKQREVVDSYAGGQPADYDNETLLLKLCRSTLHANFHSRPTFSKEVPGLKPAILSKTGRDHQAAESTVSL